MFKINESCAPPRSKVRHRQEHGSHYAGAGDRGRAAAPQAHVPAGAAYSSSTGARASGPRIFIGKLNKETTESDVKVRHTAAVLSDNAPYNPCDKVQLDT